MKEKKKFTFRSRRFIAVFLALALTVCLGMATLTSAGAVSISGFNVTYFARVNTSVYTGTSIPASQFTGRGVSNSTVTWGIYVDLPASSSPSYLSIMGFSVHKSSDSSVSGLTSITSLSSLAGDQGSRPVVGVLLDTSSSAPELGVTTSPSGYAVPQISGDSSNFLTFSIPSHSQPMRFYLCSSVAANYPFFAGVYRSSSASISLDSSPWITLQISINQLLEAVKGIGSSVSQPSPMDKFESDYLTNFSGQIDKTEQYIGSDSPVLPDNFLTSGSDGSPSMVDSITDNMGFSNSSFDSQKFGDAVGSLSGSSSTGDSGPWQFFTDEVANDMATGGMSYALRPPDPMEELEEWINQSDGWLGSW